MVSGGSQVDLIDSPAVANIKSQIKRNRQNERRRVRNKTTRSRLRTEVKSVEAVAASGDAQTAEARLRETSRLLDKAASKGAIHRRTAARRKAKLARAVNAARSS
jgi:small subunit ribosomal protein S20